MKQVRVSGLVRLAKHLRQELAGPVTPARLARMRCEVENALRVVEQLPQDSRSGRYSLPSPSRKAYEFLKGLNWDAVVVDPSGSAAGRPRESVSFRGLPGYFNRLLDRLARAAGASAQAHLEAPGTLPPDRRAAPAVSSQDRHATRQEQGQGVSLQPMNHRQDADATTAANGHMQLPCRDPRRDASCFGPQTLATAREQDPNPGPAALTAVDEVYETIRSDSANIEREVQAQEIRPEHLTPRARELRGWFAYFARREHFDAYCAAVRRAEPIFRGESNWSAKKDFEVLIQFRPRREMYHIAARAGRAVVQLPTPSISFDEDLLRSVARIAFKKGGDRQAVHDAVTGQPYQKIARALEQAGGLVVQARGVHHDLDASFDRVNAAYFDSRLERPRLTWSRTFAARKFGHYDYAHDTIMVNMVLDRPTVPEYAVDLIVYHELLHQQLGVTWRNNRVAAHTPELARRERQFKEYEQAKAVLRKLASER